MVVFALLLSGLQEKLQTTIPWVDSKLGYGGVLGRSVGLAVGFAAAGAALLWLGNPRARE